MSLSLVRKTPVCFVAIDFETADERPDSACAVALVRVVNDEITERTSVVIRPPRRAFVFTYLHGIAWDDVAEQPCFAEWWPHLAEKMKGADFLAAHNAKFDQGVLTACCQAAGVAPPPLPFVCTVQLARSTWNIHPTKLPNVCAALKLPLNHHNAASDAEACARIVIAARQKDRRL
jgi:DNA polymerase-3 subunit epsilon